MVRGIKQTDKKQTNKNNKTLTGASGSLRRLIIFLRHNYPCEAPGRHPPMLVVLNNKTYKLGAIQVVKFCLFVCFCLFVLFCFVLFFWFLLFRLSFSHVWKTAKILRIELVLEIKNDQFSMSLNIPSKDHMRLTGTTFVH